MGEEMANPCEALVRAARLVLRKFVGDRASHSSEAAYVLLLLRLSNCELPAGP
jgi:hypothetical protein